MSNYESGESRRRDIEAKTTVQKAIEAKRKRLAQPPAIKPRAKALGTEGQLERSIYLTNLALNKYEVKLEDGDELTPEEERVFMSMQDSLRKLATTLSALKQKVNLGNDSEVELAKKMVESGIPKDEVIALYPANPKVAAALKELP